MNNHLKKKIKSYVSNCIELVFDLQIISILK
jgi:hypothetical protein